MKRGREEEGGRLGLDGVLRDGDSSVKDGMGYSPPPAAGADLRAALVASCLRGAWKERER